MSPAIAREFKQLCRKAVKCRWCFSELSVKAPTIDIAQPRWIGRTYWAARPRVLVLMLNPGSGESRIDGADEVARHLLRRFSRGDGTLRAVLDHLMQDARGWGGGRFERFYSTDLGLTIERIAFANVAWCSTRGNIYPPRMLEQCYSLHTEALLRMLAPQVVLLSGSGTHRFQTRIANLLPQAKIIPMLHFAHREGRAAWARKSLQIRRQINGPDKVDRKKKR
jgi:hypothetical protein